MSFAEMVREKRKEAGLSQEELAEELNVSRQSVAKWESDTGYPEMKMTFRLASKLNVTLDALFREELESTKQRLSNESEAKIQEEREKELLDDRHIRKDQITAALDELETGFPQKEILTGYSFIDENKNESFSRCGLQVLVGAKLMGKTVFALNIVNNVIKNNGNVLYFIKDKPVKRVMRVFLGIYADVPVLSPDYKRSEAEYLKLKEAGKLVEKSGLSIESAYEDSVESIYEKCVNRKNQLDLIVVDNVEDLYSAGKGDDKKYVFKILRKLAHSCRCPVLALVQAGDLLDKMMENGESSQDLMEEATRSLPLVWHDGLILLYRKDYYCTPDKHDGVVTMLLRRVSYDEGLSVIEGNLSCDYNTFTYTEIKRE